MAYLKGVVDPALLQVVALLVAHRRHRQTRTESKRKEGLFVIGMDTKMIGNQQM